MKWKDSAEMADGEEKSGEEFFGENHYSPWEERKDVKGLNRINRPSLQYILLILAIVVLVAALFIVIWSGSDETVGDLEERVTRLEARLQKFESIDVETIDEKITRIWQQAGSFEEFKDRFDRTEASTQLRMDHLTMSLEALQKQLSGMRNSDADKSPASSTKSVVAVPEADKIVRYHIVTPSETFYSISKKYDLTVSSLLKLNHMTEKDVLQVGQKLIVSSNPRKK